MNSNEVIDAYVTDVARRLPRRQRNDVAFELGALLREEVQDRADAAGREADAAMTEAFLREFGHPADVAIRYRPAMHIVDPADARAFLHATIIGLALIWIAGLVEHFAQPIRDSGAFLTLVGRWWVSTVIASMWWPGVLVVGFALHAWVKRRWPRPSDWTAESSDDLRANRFALLLAIVGIAAGVWALWDPRVLLDLVFGGKAAYSAYEALTYTPAFREGAATWLFGALLLYIPVFLAVLVKGRWSPRLRSFEDALGIVIFALMAWALLTGPVMAASTSDGMFRLALLLSLVGSVGVWIHRYRRRVTPAPASAGHAVQR